MGISLKHIQHKRFFFFGQICDKIANVFYFIFCSGRNFLFIIKQGFS